MVEYETFVNCLAELKEGEARLTVRDRATYEARRVKAVIAQSGERLPGGNKLYIRFNQGVMYKKPWMIKITEELGGLFKD